MTKNVLVAFGDSYGAGAEIYESGWNIGSEQNIHDDKNFIQVLARDYDECFNFSTVGASIPGYLNQLKKFYKIYNEANHYTLLVMLTQHNRDFIYSKNKGWIDLYPGMSKTDSSYKNDEEQWYNLVNYPETAILNWYRTVSIIQSFCNNKNINDIYIEQFNPSPFVNDLEFLIDRNKIYTSPIIKELFFNNGNDSVGTLDWKNFLKTDNYKKYYSPNYHPNIIGHEIIGKKIKIILHPK